MFNEESGEDNRNSKVKSFIGGMAKNKGKKTLRKLLIRLMIPWGALICFVLFIIIFCIGAAKVGTTGEHTFSDTMNKYDNKALADYLKTKVKNANGDMDDYYGMAKRVGITEGNVEGFVSLAELETGKDINKMMAAQGLTDLEASELVISKYADLLKPEFNYSECYIVTTTTTNVKDSEGKNTTTISTSKKKIKLLNMADTIKGKVDITYKINSTTSSQTSTRTYEVPVTSTNPPASGSMALQPTATSQANAQSTNAANTTSQQSQTTQSTSAQQAKKVTETTTIITKVDTPIVDKITESKKHFERLKGIIKSEFPNEKSDDDLNMSVHYVINGTGSDYDTSEQDGDWMNSEVDDNIVDDILGVDAGGFSGMIPLFRQNDPRWKDIPYGQGTIETSGCGPTSFAMVISGLEGNLGSWDKNGDKILDPGEAAAYAKAEGYNSTTGEGTSWALFEQASASRFGLNSTEVEPTNYSTVYDALKNGYPVVVSMHEGHFTKGGHFIVLTGVDTDGQVLINDPNPATGINKFSMQGIANEANRFWIFKNPNLKFEQYEMTVYGGHKDAMEGLSGVTADGTNVNGYLDFSGRIIATDPSVIPIGSKILIRFPENIRHQKTADGKDFDMNGIYTARDTGGAIKGHHIDLFMGYGAYAEKMINSIGTRQVWIMKK